MKKSPFKYCTWFLVLFFSTNQVFAQQGIGTDKPNKASVLDLTSNSKGILFPRVALKSTTNFSPISGINANENHLSNSLAVYNTATDGANEFAVKPGYYYWEKVSNNSVGKWKRLMTDSDISEWILKGDVVGVLSNNTVEKIQKIPVSTNTPSSGQVLQYNGSSWMPTNLNAATVTAVNNGLSLNGTIAELGGNLTKNTVITQNNSSLTIATGGSDFAISGLKKGTVQGANDYLMSVGSDHIVKAVKASMPKFFYMPSMFLPLAADQIVDSMHTTHANGVYTVNLYNVYKEQFSGSNNTSSVSNSTKTTVLPVLSKNELDYYITFYDNTVYSNVTVNNDGILTYKVVAQADPNSGSFMNIVFAVKP